MFWRRTSSTKIPAQGAIPLATTANQDAAGAELDASVETLAEVLRARARYAFGVGAEDASAIAGMFERWAAHVLVRSAPPGQSSEDAARNGQQRDWRGLASFVNGHARREQEWVVGSTRDMRDAIFALVDSFRRSSAAQGRQDVMLSKKLQSLHVALDSGSIDSLKREALAVASAVTEVLEEQRVLAEQQTKDLRERLASLSDQLEQTRREGETDPLTNIANRRVFDATLARALTVAGVLGQPLTLMMVDIDHFKAVNDTHGHPAGDEVLRAVADVLSRTFPRRSDLVARYGGEEFAIVLPDTGLADVAMLHERLLKAVRALRVNVGTAVLSVTASVGIAIADTNVAAADVVVRADRALYAAKRGGRDRAVVAAEGTQAAA